MRKYVFASLLLCAAPLAAQTLVPSNALPAVARAANCSPPSCGTSLASSENYTLRRDIREVRVEFKVTDRKGRFHEVLPTDVQILDNGNHVSELTGFTRDSDLPVNIAILIDSSRSTEHELPMEKQVALGFVREFLRPGDKALIAGFNSYLQADDQFTDDNTQLEKSVDRIVAGNLTAFHDAIYQLAQRFPKRTDSAAARNVLIIVSDGNDTLSLRGFSDGLDRLLRRNVTVFTVSVLDHDAAEPSPELQRLSGETAGDSFYIYSRKALQKTFDAINFEVRNYYVATYRAPKSQSASFHQLSVRVAERSLKAETRVGYYAGN